MYRNDTGKLRFDLFDYGRCSGRNDGDAGKVLDMVDLCHRQAFNIVATAGKQADDAGQNASLVIDEYSNRVCFDLVAQIAT